MHENPKTQKDTIPTVVLVMILIGGALAFRSLAAAETASSEVGPFEVLAYEILEDLDGTLERFSPGERPRVAIWPFNQESTPVSPALANEYNAKLLSSLLTKGRDRYRFVAQEGLKTVVKATSESIDVEEELDEVLATLAREARADVLIIGSLRRAAKDRLVLSYKAIAVADGNLLAATSRVRIRLDPEEIHSAEGANSLDQAVHSAAQAIARQVPHMRELQLGDITSNDSGAETALGRYLKSRFAEALSDEYRSMVTGDGLVVQVARPSDSAGKLAGSHLMNGRYWDLGDAIEINLSLSGANGITASWRGRVKKDHLPLGLQDSPIIAGSPRNKEPSASHSSPASKPKRGEVPSPDRRLVRLVQRDLAALGYHPGEIDGLLGPRTRAAIRAYQYQIGLLADGRITDALLDSLRHSMAGVARKESLPPAVVTAGSYGVKVPPSHLPPPGLCRLWYPGWPPGHQPPPFHCPTVSRHHQPELTRVSASVAPSAPVYNTGLSKEAAGTFIGAGLGGLAGSRIGHGKGRLAATAAGVFFGALLGNRIGRTMDQVDHMKARQAYMAATVGPIGQSVAWYNPYTGNRGSVTPLRDGNSSHGRYCREFQQQVFIGARREIAYGTACRQPDGSWQITRG